MIVNFFQSKANKFFVFCMLFILGVLFVSASKSILKYLVIYVLILLCLSILKSYILNKNKNLLQTLLLIIFFFFLGIIRWFQVLPDYSSNKFVQFYWDKRIVLLGIVAQKERKKFKSKIIVNVKKINNNDVVGKVLVYSNDWSLDYGDWLKISCKLNKPPVFPDFNYLKYLEKDGIGGICYEDKIIKLGNKSILPLFIFYKFRERLQNKIEKLLPSPESNLLEGILLGMKNSLSTDLKQQISASGLSHIIVVSGLHISLLLELFTLAGIYIGLSRENTEKFIILILICFLMIIGFPPSAIRGSLMGLLIIVSRFIQRKRYMRNSLAFSAAVMVFYNPYYLVYDLGFQLSFLATIGIIYFSPYLEKFLTKFLTKNLFLSIFISSLSASIIIFPLLITVFKKFSLLGIFANILVLGLMPYLMILSFIMIFLSFVSVKLALLVGFAVYIILNYILRISMIFSSLSWGIIRF